MPIIYFLTGNKKYNQKWYALYYFPHAFNNKFYKKL